MQQGQTLNVRKALFLLLLPMCSLFEVTFTKYVEGHLTTAEVSCSEKFGWGKYSSFMKFVRTIYFVFLFQPIT